MGFYERRILPHIVHCVCGSRQALRQRRRVVPLAAGDVLEIGFGSGLNLPHYDPARVHKVFALEPSEEMWGLARPLVAEAAVAVDFLHAGAEEVPLVDASVDTVLVTYALCTVRDPGAALREARRVLRPGGRLVFCEHGAAPDPGVRRWQRRLDPLWTRLAGGCHLDRDVPSLLAAGSFAVESLATAYLPGWRPASFNSWGTAVPAGTTLR